MKTKHLIIIVMLVILVAIAIIIFTWHQKSNKTDVKIPILLYHDFITTVPDSDPDNLIWIKIM